MTSRRTSLLKRFTVYFRCFVVEFVPLVLKLLRLSVCSFNLFLFLETVVLETDSSTLCIERLASFQCFLSSSVACCVVDVCVCSSELRVLSIEALDFGIQPLTLPPLAIGVVRHIAGV